jgi:tight adherence protein C
MSVVTSVVTSVDAATLAGLAAAATVLVIAAAAPRPAPRAFAHGAPGHETPGSSGGRRSAVRALGATATGAAALLVGGWWLVALLAAARPLVRALVRRRTRRLAAGAADAALPGAIEVLVLTIRAGHVPAAAVTTAAAVSSGPSRDAFEAVAFRMRRGEPLATALGALVDHLGPAAGPVVDVVASAQRAGTPLGPTLESLAREAREVRRRQAAAAARVLPVRLSFPLVVCTLPAFALLTVGPVLLATWSRLAPAP